MHTHNGDNIHNRNQTHQTNIFVCPDSDWSEIKQWESQLKRLGLQLPDGTEKIKPLLQFLVTVTQATRIYRMQNHRIPDKQAIRYLDLLIVLPPENAKAITELQPVLTMPYLKHWEVCCSLHNEDQVIDGLQKGHIFYSLHCTAENILYDGTARTYPVTDPAELLTIKKSARALFEQSLSRAQDFYETAILLQKKQSPLTAFMLQQAAELTCRGVLQSLNGYEKRTHEIRVLRKQVRRCAPQLSEIFSENTTEEKTLLTTLDNAYLATRYSNTFTIAAAMLTELFDRTALLMKTAQEVVQGTLKSA